MFSTQRCPTFGACQEGPAKHRKEHKRANLFKNTRISTRDQLLDIN